MKTQLAGITIPLIFLLVCLGLFRPGSILMSQVHLFGQIIDQGTSEGISSVHIIKPDGRGSISDEEGFFDLEVDSLPVNLIIRHTAYGESQVHIDYPAPNPLIIRIMKHISQIGQVQVSVERMRILNENMNVSISDFALDNQQLWMLGYRNNQADQGFLWLASSLGDTICSLAFHGAAELFRDVFGNVHLINKDQALQLFGLQDSIVIIDTLSLSEFNRDLRSIKARFTDKLVYQAFLPGKQGLHFFYYDPAEPRPKFLTLVRDSAEEQRHQHDLIYGVGGEKYFKNVIDKELTIDRLLTYQNISNLKKNRDRIINRDVKAPLIGTSDHLYLFNLYKDSLLTYSADGRLESAIPITFHRRAHSLSGFEYANFDCLHDPISNQIYLLTKQSSGSELVPFDTSTGMPGSSLNLPRLSGMTKVKVWGYAAYFLYADKTAPGYNRLYRLQL